MNQLKIVGGGYQHKQRLSYVDFAKFIGIFFVVVSHAGCAPLLDKLIHIFHMPLFFLISGYTFNFEKHSINTKYFVISRLKSFMIPYFVFSIAIFVLRILLDALNIWESYSFNTFIKVLFYNCCIDSLQGTVQWFIPCLFFTELLVLFSYWVFNKYFCVSYYYRMLVAALLFGIIGFVFPFICPIRLPMGLDVSFVGVLFFVIGNWTWHFDLINRFDRSFNSTLTKVLVIILMTVAGSAIGLVNVEISMRELKYGNVFLFLCSSLLIVMAILVLCNILNKIFISTKIYQKIILYLGQNTLVVLLMNRPIILCLTVIFSKLHLANSIISFYIRPIFIMVICYFIAQIINTFFPIVLGRERKIKPQE